jgi:hypothetical protein
MNTAVGARTLGATIRRLQRALKTAEHGNMLGPQLKALVPGFIEIGRDCGRDGDPWSGAQRVDVGASGDPCTLWLEY